MAILHQSTVAEVNFGDLVIANFGTSNFTVAMWCKLDAISTFTRAIEKREGAGHSNFWNITINSSGQFSAEVDEDAVGTDYIAVTGATTGFDNGTWNHVAITRISSRLNLYVNGTLDASTTATSVASLSNTASLKTNRSTDSQATNSSFSIEDMRIWNGSALSLKQIQTLANGYRGPIGGESGWWTFGKTTTGGMFNNVLLSTGTATVPDDAANNFGTPQSSCYGVASEAPRYGAMI